MQSYNREYRSSIFAMLFQDRKELLKLYNALNGTDYQDYENITINTLENDGVPSGILMKRTNDVSFVFRSYLNLYEHQSTVCGNMSLRLLLYVSDLFYDIIPKQALYGKKIVKLPVPKFVVFYNGLTEMPEKEEVKLSDQYELSVEEPDLELKAVIYNINRGNNRRLLEKCQTLSEYSEFVARMQEVILKRGLSEGEQKACIEEVIDRCIEENILRDFLTKHREAVVMYSRLAYDEEAHMAAIREDSYDDGYDNGQTDKTLDDTRKLMEKLKLTAEEALDILDVPEEEQSDYLKKLNNNTNEEESAELYAHDIAN